MVISLNLDKFLIIIPMETWIFFFVFDFCYIYIYMKNKDFSKEEDG